MKSRDELKEGELKIEQFFTHLAVHKKVAPSTQNQAMYGCGLKITEAIRT
jgi:hypothetical protein